MLRLHRAVAWNKSIDIACQKFIDTLTGNRIFTKHCFDKLKYQLYGLELRNAGKTFQDYKYNVNDVFECYGIKIDNVFVVFKVCFRIKGNNIDYIVIVGENNHIVTIYANDTNDKHNTLKTYLYDTNI